jgi:PAS domain S-box-containing protein
MHQGREDEYIMNHLLQSALKMSELPVSLLQRLAAEAERRGLSVEALLSGWAEKQPDSARDMRDMYALTDANPDLIARFNRDFQYTYLNPSAIKVVGKPVEDVLGRTLYDIGIDPALSDFLISQLRIAFETGREHRTQYELPGRKGPHYYDVQMIPMAGIEGRIESVLTVSRDVTARRLAEAALRDSERRYRSIVEGQVDIVVLYYPDTTVAFVNDAYCKYFGKSREEIVGKTFIDLTDLSERPRIYSRLKEVLANPAPKVEEYQLTDGAGNVRWISWVDHGILNDDGKVIMVQAIGRDITHIKRIEDAIEVERERYQLLFDESPLPLLVYDVDTLQYLAVNASAIATYGYTRAEFLNMTLMDLRPANEIPRLSSALEDGHATNDGAMGIWKHRRKNGTTFDVEITGRNITYNGRHARLILAVDITERSALEAERMYTQSLEIELQKEREITMLKERFTSMVTHEFRTPLSVIVSTVDILKNYLDRLSKDNIARKLDIVTSEAKRMTTLLDDVLTLSRATAGRLRVTPEAFDAVEVLQGLVDNLRLTDNNQHHFDLKKSCSQATVVTDQRLVEQILINLLTNAVKYSPPATTITTEICAAADHITLRVIDEGRGIPEEDQPRIFDAFHRAENAAGTEGTGLGLAIVKESVALLGGEITFDSTVGKGTIFTVNLPVQAVLA